MIRLMREVRLFTRPTLSTVPSQDGNHWAGTTPGAMPPFWVFRIIVEGAVDRRTGYVCDIKRLDDLVREVLSPALAGTGPVSFSSAGTAGADGFAILSRKMAPLRLFSVQIRFSPHTLLTFTRGVRTMTLLTQSFEFSASHRLHSPGQTDEENLRLFGKCSNPHGHGHNYVLEVTVEVEPGQAGLMLERLDRVARTEVIERFDHKNLNVECPEFRDLNPTMENIAQVIFDRLVGGADCFGLASVRVWETPKTYAECFSASTSAGRTPIDR